MEDDGKKYRLLTFDEMADLHELGVRGFEFFDGEGWQISCHNKQEYTSEVRAKRWWDGDTRYSIALE